LYIWLTKPSALAPASPLSVKVASSQNVSFQAQTCVPTHACIRRVEQCGRIAFASLCCSPSNQRCRFGESRTKLIADTKNNASRYAGMLEMASCMTRLIEWDAQFTNNARGSASQIFACKPFIQLRFLQVFIMNLMDCWNMPIAKCSTAFEYEHNCLHCTLPLIKAGDCSLRIRG
jgi:hypothetical protein